MTLEHQSALSAVAEALSSADDGDLMRRILQGALQALVEAEAEAHIGAARHERTAERTTWRNGVREKLVATTAGDLTVKIPKTRTGSFFPTLLHPRRRIDRALHAVVMEAYVHGVSTRKVDDLVEALGVASGISKSEVSRICADLDTEVAAFTSRPLDTQATPYVFLDATYCKARVRGRVVSQAVVIATGVTADGHREVLGCNVGNAETLDFWKQFPAACAIAACAGSSWSSPTSTAGWFPRSSRRWPAPPGRGAGSTSCATCWRRSPRARSRQSRRWSAPSSPSPPRRWSASR